jgi:hypothetical protein
MQKVIFLPKVDRKYGSDIKPRSFNWHVFRVMLGPDRQVSETHPLRETKTKQGSKTHTVHTWIIARQSW